MTAPFGLSWDPKYELLYVGTGNTGVSTVGVNGAIVTTNWGPLTGLQSASVSVDPTLGVVYMLTKVLITI